MDSCSLAAPPPSPAAPHGGPPRCCCPRSRSRWLFWWTTWGWSWGCWARCCMPAARLKPRSCAGVLLPTSVLASRVLQPRGGGHARLGRAQEDRARGRLVRRRPDGLPQSRPNCGDLGDTAARSDGPCGTLCCAQVLAGKAEAKKLILDEMYMPQRQPRSSDGPCHRQPRSSDGPWRRLLRGTPLSDGPCGDRSSACGTPL